ncbi:COPT1-like protein [Mya arenaria]|uniref:COPT1-like protein n=1 Tax=Mya arenaria TaxID=6604 RepID=A0ABY7GC19_MYAAR|nr:COPT1-like protein [Mya arenaria]
MKSKLLMGLAVLQAVTLVMSVATKTSTSMEMTTGTIMGDMVTPVGGHTNSGVGVKTSTPSGILSSSEHMGGLPGMDMTSKKTSSGNMDMGGKGNIDMGGMENMGSTKKMNMNGIGNMNMTGVENMNMSGMANMNMSGMGHINMSGMDHMNMSGMANMNMSGMANMNMSGMANMNMSGMANMNMSGMVHMNISGMANMNMHEMGNMSGKGNMSGMGHMNMSGMGHMNMSGMGHMNMHEMGNMSGKGNMSGMGHMNMSGMGHMNMSGMGHMNMHEMGNMSGKGNMSGMGHMNMSGMGHMNMSGMGHMNMSGMGHMNMNGMGHMNMGGMGHMNMGGMGHMNMGGMGHMNMGGMGHMGMMDPSKKGCNMMGMLKYVSCHSLYLLGYRLLLIGPWRMTPQDMVAACVVLLAFAAVFEAWKMLRQKLKRLEMSRLGPKPSAVAIKGVTKNQTAWVTFYKMGVREAASSMFGINHMSQSCMHVVQVIVSYIIMLAFMNFNVWICISIVLGSGLGYFLFGWTRSSVSDTEDHHAEK